MSQKEEEDESQLIEEISATASASIQLPFLTMAMTAAGEITDEAKAALEYNKKLAWAAKYLAKDLF